MQPNPSTDTSAPRSTEEQRCASLVATFAADTDGVIRDVTPALCRLLETTADTLIGTPWLDLVAAESRSSVQQSLAAHGPDPRPLSLDIKCGVHQRDLAPTRVFLQRDSGGMSAALFSIEDLCARQAMVQKKLRETEERLSSDENLVTTVSHELRTPLNGIIGLSQLLMETRLNDEQRDLVTGVLDCGQALLAVINDLLEVSRLRAGELRLECLDFDPGEVVEQTVCALATLADDKGVELVVDVGADAPPRFRGDPARLRQVIVNLVGNAIKFTSTGYVVARVRSHADGLRIEVADSGIGISEEAQTRLFARFSQADRSTSRVHGGSGLGLAICQQLVELMDGKISVRSELGHGSTFICTLPNLITLRPDDKETPMDAQEHLLWVSPSPRLTGPACAYLEEWGFSVHTESDLEGADRYLRLGSKTDVVLVDADLGAEQLLPLTRRLTNQRVIIAATFQQRAELRELGASKIKVVSKPIRRNQLRRAAVPANARRPTGKQSVQLMLSSKPKILIAEDNRINQKVIRRIVNGLGYDCELVADGQAAVDACQETEYQVVLMDSQMPVLDGFEATKAIRNLAGTPGRVPIIALTADAFPGTREVCRRVGMDDYLTKPVHQPSLIAVLKRWAPLNPEDARVGLSEEEHDAVGELLNMAVGDAAAALSQLLRQEVVLDVPQLDVMPMDEVSSCIATELSHNVSAIRQQFSGGFAANAYLLFPEDKSDALVTAVMDSTMPTEDREAFKADVLQEVGNIVLSRSIATLSDTLGSPADLEVVQWTTGSVSETLSSGTEGGNKTVLFLRVSMSLAETHVPCYVVLVMGLRSIQRFRAMVSHYLAQIAT